MPTVLSDDEIDGDAEEVDLVLTRAEEEAAESIRGWRPTDTAPDLSNGGTVNGARLYPMSDGVKQPQGRAVARRVWMWDGTESLVPLGWNPNGTQHNGARPHLLKRLCLCCRTSGFKGLCPTCVKSQCALCRGGTDKSKRIPCFYLRQEDVPFPAKFYGSIDCFLPFCLRRGDRGFLTEEAMRMHAMTRHRMEYQAFRESQAAANTSEVQLLRARLDALQAASMAGPPASAIPQANVGSNADARETKEFLAWKQRRAKARQAKAKTKAPTLLNGGASDHPIESASRE